MSWRGFTSADSFARPRRSGSRCNAACESLYGHEPNLCPIKVAIVIYRRVGYVIVDRMLAKLKDWISAPVSFLQ
jgi:hypothetical protein